jgi:hypothetical protein
VSLDKNEVEKMVRLKRKDNEVYGSFDGKNEFRDFGKYKVRIYDDHGQVVGEEALNDFIKRASSDIKALAERNKKLEKAIKLVNSDLQNYKEKVGIK